MTEDALAELGYLFLGSRMKRLAERMQADATKIFERGGFGKLLPATNAVLAILDRYGSMTISELVDRAGISQPAITRTVSGMEDQGTVQLTVLEDDKRQKEVRLTPAGETLICQLKAGPWREIRIAAEDLTRALNIDMMTQLSAMEQSLKEQPLTERKGVSKGLSIVEYDPSLARAFYEINREWISDMFVMEEVDEEVLSKPDENIISKGGTILFVRSEKDGIVGAGALMPVDDNGAFELTKMGVLSRSRGEKSGEFLLAALIGRARENDVKKLFLLTNSKCQAAIHLYEKLGFRHDQEIMETYGARYARCDVAMRFPMERS